MDSVMVYPIPTQSLPSGSWMSLLDAGSSHCSQPRCVSPQDLCSGEESYHTPVFIHPTWGSLHPGLRNVKAYIPISLFSLEVKFEGLAQCQSSPGVHLKQGASASQCKSSFCPLMQSLLCHRRYWKHSLVNCPCKFPFQSLFQVWKQTYYNISLMLLDLVLRRIYQFRSPQQVIYTSNDANYNYRDHFF